MANRSKRLPSSQRSAPINRFKSLGNVKENISNLNQRVMLKKRYSRAVAFAQAKPFTSFFIALGFLLFVIVLGSTVFKVRTPEVAERSEPKRVEVYRLGASPRVSVQGEVKKGGVIKIVAQAPGIVSAVNFVEGAYVWKGNTLINLASNYNGANAATVGRQLAGATYKNTKDSYDIQKTLIQRQRDLANRTSDNSKELRDITKVSIEETKSLINLNNDILDPIKEQIEDLEANNGDPAQIQALKSTQAQMQAGINQLNSALRMSEYSVNTDKPAVDLERIGRDIALAQIDLQEKALNFGLQAAGLQFKLAQIQESAMYPSAPFNATVQKVHVKIGDSVNPGTPLLTLAGDTGEVVIDALVPQDIAEKVSRVDSATITLGNKKVELVPSYISSEATSGQLYSVLFTLPEEYRQYVTDSSFVSVSLSVGHNMGDLVPFIPVDSIFQTQEEAFVFVVENGKAKSKKVTLGPVTGGFVTVEKGIGAKDQVILNRTVIEGDQVKVIN